MRKRKYVMTSARRAALRKAQFASARKRRGRSNRPVALYHYTGNKTARKIVRQQHFKTTVRISGVKTTNPFNDPGYVYFSKRRNDPYWGRGVFRQKYGQVSVKVPSKLIERDPNDFQIFGVPIDRTKKMSRAYRVQQSNLQGRPINLVYARKTVLNGRKVKPLSGLRTM